MNCACGKPARVFANGKNQCWGCFGEPQTPNVCPKCGRWLNVHNQKPFIATCACGWTRNDHAPDQSTVCPCGWNEPYQHMV